VTRLRVYWPKTVGTVLSSNDSNLGIQRRGCLARAGAGLRKRRPRLSRDFSKRMAEHSLGDMPARAGVRGAARHVALGQPAHHVQWPAVTSGRSLWCLAEAEARRDQEFWRRNGKAFEAKNRGSGAPFGKTFVSLAVAGYSDGQFPDNPLVSRPVPPRRRTG